MAAPRSRAVEQDSQSKSLLSLFDRLHDYLKMTGEPIVFQHPGLPIDTRLVVLGQEYHVNSAMLKDHSAFFFAFLDSPDKREHVTRKRNLDKETGRGFIYEWVSIIDSDGLGWSLVAQEGATADPTTSLNLSDFNGDKKFEIDTFDKLLRAIHREPYSLKTHDQFLAMVKLADYYCALPAFSKSLDGPLARGEIRVTDLNCQEMLVYALQLRHADMFRECIIYIAGNCNWNMEYRFDNSNFDAKIQLIIKNARVRIREKILALKSLADKAGSYFCPVHGHPFESNGVSVFPRSGSLSIPAFLRCVMQKIEDCCDPLCIQCHGNHLRYILRYHLLRNNLRFMRNELVQGEDLYDNFFLCTEVVDKDLPWDLSEKDW